MGNERVRGTMPCCEGYKSASGRWPRACVGVQASTGPAWLRKVEEGYATTAVKEERLFEQ